VLARFDQQTPALIEKRRGLGVVWVLAAGWEPVESQLAASSKFVPLLASMLDFNESEALTSDYEVNEVVPMSSIAKGSQLIRPDGQSIEIDRSPFTFRDTQVPGIYAITNGPLRDEFAVNLAASESRTTPMDVAELEQKGVALASRAPVEDYEMKQRQLRDLEIESRQQAWRWLILGALCLLGIETLVARLTGGPSREPIVA
jgi:hypothetical protein